MLNRKLFYSALIKPESFDKRLVAFLLKNTLGLDNRKWPKVQQIAEMLEYRPNTYRHKPTTNINTSALLAL